MEEDLLKPYKLMVEFLGKALGPSYEITLHDLSSENSGIVAIANGEISGRSLGSPVTSIALKMLAQKEYEHSDYRLSYTGQLASGKTIRSSTMFIKDQTGKPVGLLCVNFDDSKFHEMEVNLLKLLHPDSFVEQHYLPSEGGVRIRKPAELTEQDSPENYHADIQELMQEIFDDVANGYSVALDRLTQTERTDMISKLDDRGLFRLKGAVPFVAEKLVCSQASVYRYLSKTRDEKLYDC